VRGGAACIASALCRGVARPTRAVTGGGGSGGFGSVESSLADSATYRGGLRSERHILSGRALGVAEGLYKRVVSPTRANTVESGLAVCVALSLGVRNIEIRLAGCEAGGLDSGVASPTFAPFIGSCKSVFARLITRSLGGSVAGRLGGVNGRSHDKESKCAFEHVVDLGGSER